jgi:hypothetical protein
VTAESTAAGLAEALATFVSREVKLTGLAQTLGQL